MQASIDAQQAEEESWRRDLPDERCYRLGQRVTHHRGFQGSIVGCAVSRSLPRISRYTGLVQGHAWDQCSPEVDALGPLASL